MIGNVIVADDITGGNDAGVIMAKEGYGSYAVMSLEAYDKKASSGCECIVYSTDTRSTDKETGYKRVFEAVNVLKQESVKVYSKRIDTTLRGNLGAEIDAMLEALGDGRVAMIVPCFPASKRITVGGYILVHAVPLNRTEVAQDPKNPVHTPLCAEVIESQSKYPVGHVSLLDLMKGKEAVAEKIQALAREGKRSIVFDAVSEADIEFIADAVILSGVGFIAVDPGLFNMVIARKLIPLPRKKRGKVLVVVGSINAVTRRQVDCFLAQGEGFTVFMETREFLEKGERQRREIDRVAGEILAHSDSHDVCCIIGRGVFPEFRVPFEPYAERYTCSLNELSNLINESVAEIAHRIISERREFRSMYSTGGDITVAICERLGNTGLKLLDEIIPLSAYGELMGGSYEGFRIVSKGGMVGEDDTIVTCVKYLKEKMDEI